MSQSDFHLPKNSIRDNSNKISLHKRTLRDIILSFLDRTGLDMKLQEWKQLCCKASENEYEYILKDSFARRGEGRYTFRN